MRILMLDNEFPPLGGGAGNATACLAREWAANGVFGLVLNLEDDNVGVALRLPGATVRDNEGDPNAPATFATAWPNSPQPTMPSAVSISTARRTLCRGESRSVTVSMNPNRPYPPQTSRKSSAFSVRLHVRRRRADGRRPRCGRTTRCPCQYPSSAPMGSAPASSCQARDSGE